MVKKYDLQWWGEGWLEVETTMDDLAHTSHRVNIWFI